VIAISNSCSGLMLRMLNKKRISFMASETGMLEYKLLKLKEMMLIGVWSEQVLRAI
jgi:hypothetical protein